MKQDWTKEPWKITGSWDFPTIHTDNGNEKIAGILGKANADRIKACINACAGLSNEDLKLVKEGVERLKHDMAYHALTELLNRIEKGE